MCAILQFKKIGGREGVLFDEYFLEAAQVDIIQFNYDGDGSALCRIEGRLEKIAKAKINRILFGAGKSRLEDFLTAIFDPDFQAEDSPRRFGELQFRLPALKEMSKMDISNLAKKTLKDVHAMETDVFTYYEEIPCP